MKRLHLNWLSVCALALVLVTTALAGTPVEIKLKDGSKWRGQTADVVQVRYLQQAVEVPLEGKLIKVEPLYVIVEGVVAGANKQVTIFKSDIVSMKTTSAASDAVADTSATPAGADPNPSPVESTKAAPDSAKNEKQLGAFVLPLEGTVGETFRHEEIEELGKYIDKNYGPGQIIILRINSNGGSAPETSVIGKVIGDLRKRHRVVAWIEKAISAGCQTAMYCNEIYFQTTGTAGAVTTWNPGSGRAVEGPLLEKILDEFARVAEDNGYSRHIALSMKMNRYQCSYDKDPVTGVVTFYGDLSGEFKLSNENQNLCFTSSNAVHCGFADGVADTEEQLARLLNLPKWHEPSDYGRRLARDWQRTCEEAKRDLQLIVPRLSYKNQSTGDPVVIIGTQIQLINDAIRWWNRCHNVCEMMGVPPKEELERVVSQMKKDLADIKRAQR